MTISSDVCLKENEKLFIDVFLLYIFIFFTKNPKMNLDQKSNPSAETLKFF